MSAPAERRCPRCGDPLPLDGKCDCAGDPDRNGSGLHSLGRAHMQVVRLGRGKRNREQDPVVEVWS